MRIQAWWDDRHTFHIFRLSERDEWRRKVEGCIGKKNKTWWKAPAAEVPYWFPITRDTPPCQYTRTIVARNDSIQLIPVARAFAISHCTDEEKTSLSGWRKKRNECHSWGYNITLLLRRCHLPRWLPTFQIDSRLLLTRWMLTKYRIRGLSLKEPKIKSPSRVMVILTECLQTTGTCCFWTTCLCHGSYLWNVRSVSQTMTE